MLTDATAMVAVVKKSKADRVKGEMIENKIKFGKKIINHEENEVVH